MEYADKKIRLQIIYDEKNHGELKAYLREKGLYLGNTFDRGHNTSSIEETIKLLNIIADNNDIDIKYLDFIKGILAKASENIL